MWLFMGVRFRGEFRLFLWEHVLVWCGFGMIC